MFGQVQTADCVENGIHALPINRYGQVLWAGLLYLVTLPLWILLIAPGWLAWGIISIWFLYRIIKGMLRMNKDLPMES